MEELRMILITGATGNNGVEIIKALCHQGTAARAMVRKKPDKPVFPDDVEIAIADFDDAPSMRRALEGIDRVFLVTPSSERVEEQQLRFLDLAGRANVKHIVYLSQLHAKEDSPVRFLRYHAAVESALKKSGIAFTNLRPNLYMQGLLLFKQMIATQNQIAAPIGDARVSIVDVRDIAAVAVSALTEDGHYGKTYDITGPEALTHAEIASHLSDSIGRQIRFVDISEADMLNALLRFHMPSWQAEGLVEDYAHYRRGEAASISQDVKAVTGQLPRNIQTFAREYKSIFTN
jgi:uncharacterized protein YbjT (DUF2867 family)